MLASSCSQPPAPREGTRPNFLHSQEEEPSHLAESAGQAPRAGSGPGVSVTSQGGWEPASRPIGPDSPWSLSRL